MGRKEADVTYEVYLQSDIATELGIDSPLTSEQIEYYDTGFWVTTGEGRDFFRYEDILTIRERSVTTADAKGGEEATDQSVEEAMTESEETVEIQTQSEEPPSATVSEDTEL